MIQGKSLVPFLCTFIFAGVSQEARGDVARYVACVVGSVVLFGSGVYFGSLWTKNTLVKRWAKELEIEKEEVKNLVIFPRSNLPKEGTGWRFQTNGKIYTVMPYSEKIEPTD
jgi:hypothetical protein